MQPRLIDARLQDHPGSSSDARSAMNDQINHQGETVNIKGHDANAASTPRMGLFATLGGLLDGQGSGAPAYVSRPARASRLPATLTRRTVSLLAVKRTPTLLCVLVTLVVCAFAASSALALTNPERHYEMASPVFKGGFGVINIEAVAENGESVAFYSPGGFAGEPAIEPSYGANANPDYLARRGASGWSTVPIVPPATLAPADFSRDVSPTLETDLAETLSGPNQENAGRETNAIEVFLHATGLPDVLGDWERVANPIAHPSGGDPPSYRSADPSFCHLLLSSNASQAYLPAAEGAGAQVYELDRGCGGQPASFRLASVNDRGAPLCREAELGSLHENNQFNAVSADGEQVFFTNCGQLFVRLGGTRTLEVSKPLAEGDGCAEGSSSSCLRAAERAGADFAGASRDGSRVFFTTTAPLAPEDHDAGSDLYMASIGCPDGESGCAASGREVRSLVQVSHDPGGGEAGVQGVVRVAPDGSRVYFVAAGDLLTAGERQALEGAGRAVPHAGADNLYVYDSLANGGAGEIAFIGDLCSGYQLSGSVEDLRCPLPNKNNSGGVAETDTPLTSFVAEAQTAGTDGRYLVFSTYAQLTTSDTNSAKDVYRYNAQAGQLQRVSLGEGGYDSNGNGGDFNAQIGQISYEGLIKEEYGLRRRAISEDGSRIVFLSSAPLSPAVSNGLENVYEWHETAGGEGSVSLISSGSATEPVEQVVISPSGQDVFFLTDQGLVPQDTDGENDVYDARLGGGFPAAPAVQQPCSGDACQGPLTNPQPLLVPGSVAQTPGENLVPPASAPAVTPKKEPVRCAKGKQLSHGKCVKRKPKKKVKRAKRSSNHRGATR
jgi:hypothetical protein